VGKQLESIIDWGFSELLNPLSILFKHLGINTEEEATEFFKNAYVDCGEYDELIVERQNICYSVLTDNQIYDVRKYKLEDKKDEVLEHLKSYSYDLLDYFDIDSYMINLDYPYECLADEVYRFEDEEYYVLVSKSGFQYY